MANRFHYVENDENVQLVVTCTDSNGDAINITGASLNLRWRLRDGTVENRAMVIVDGAAGTASYTFQASELVPPTMEYEVTLTKLDGTVVTSLEPQILGVRARLA